MGGNQQEDGLGRQHVPHESDHPLTELQSIPEVRGPPTSMNSELPDGDSTAGGSYFSTLEIPQSFSFVQSFQRANAPFLAGVQWWSQDRSLSSSVTGHHTGRSLDGLSYGSIHDIPSCSSRLTHGETEGGMPGGTSLTRPRQSRTRSQLTSSSLKRQKFLEKRRKLDTVSDSSRVLPGKRSSCSDDEDEGILDLKLLSEIGKQIDSSLQPIRKVFVNEDKMAARFDGLSLSHRLRSPSAEARRIMADLDSRIMDSDEEEDGERETRSTVVSGGQRLRMSDSLKTALRQTTTEVLPDKIAQKIANPCMAMVLWQPSINSDVFEVTPKDEPEGKDTQMMELMDGDVSVDRPLSSGRTNPSNISDPYDDMDL